MYRRKFTQIVLLGFLSLCFASISFAQSLTINYPFKTLPKAFRALGFDPMIKGNSFFVVTADVHYGNEYGGMPKGGMAWVIEEINQMNSKPAFYCIDGDMICHGPNSDSFYKDGIIADMKGYQAAIQTAIKEYKEFKVDADKLDKQVPLKLVVGNHDTNAHEIVDPKILWEVFPGYPPYQSMDLEGVHHIFLNGHTSGYIDTVQMQWLEKDVNSIPKTQTVIIFIHQPAIGRRVRERGIPAAISKAFENHQGLVWLIGGHEHYNSQKIFQLKNTKLIEHGITYGEDAGPQIVEQKSLMPGYWVYCLHNGQVAGRILKELTKGYRIEPPPDLTKARAVPMPFDNCTNILWKTLVGEGDNKYLIEAKAGNGLNFWGVWGVQSQFLVYGLPLKETNNIATTIAMLTDYQVQNEKQGKFGIEGKPGQYFVSSDLLNWQEVPLKETKEDLLFFNIPTSLQGAEKLYFMFRPVKEEPQFCGVAGYALLK